MTIKQNEKGDDKKDISAQKGGDSDNKVGESIIGKSGHPPQVPHAVTAENKANDKAEPPHQSVPNWCEICLLILEFVGVVGLGIYCVLNYLEWQTFDSERKTMETELTESRQQRMQDERAWVGTGGGGLMMPYSAAHIGLYIIFFQSWKNPAYIDNIDIVVSAADINKTNQNVVYRDSLAGSFIAPADSMKVMMNRETHFTEAQFTKITNYQAKVYFDITIKYHDIFNRCHETRQIYFLFGKEGDFAPGETIPTEKGGGMD